LTLRYAALHPPAPLSTPNHTAPPKPYTLSLHDALPIYRPENLVALRAILEPLGQELVSVSSGEDVLRTLLHRDDFAVILLDAQIDRKSTRLNSSHRTISYAVFCLKKKKNFRQSTMSKLL